jgi:hypothetical protein
MTEANVLAGRLAGGSGPHCVRHSLTYYGSVEVDEFMRNPLSHSKAVCDIMKTSSPSARRPCAGVMPGPVRGLLGGKDLTGRFLSW